MTFTTQCLKNHVKLWYNKTIGPIFSSNKRFNYGQNLDIFHFYCVLWYQQGVKCGWSGREGGWGGGGGLGASFKAWKSASQTSTESLLNRKLRAYWDSKRGRTNLSHFWRRKINLKPWSERKMFYKLIAKKSKQSSKKFAWVSWYSSDKRHEESSTINT